jgi:hypothetical protein
MAIQRWAWGSIATATEWASAAWVLFNQRLKALENFLQALTGLAVGRRDTATNADAPVVTSSAGLVLRNTAATTITGFTGGEPGQHLVVLAQDNQTTLEHGSTIRLTGNADWVVKRGETRMLWTPDGTTWFDVPRILTTADTDTIATEGLDDLVTEGLDLLEVEA